MESPTNPGSGQVTNSTARVMYQNAIGMKDQLNSAKKMGAILGIGGGSIADLLTPLGPWTLIFAVVCLSLAGWTGYVWFGNKKKELDSALDGGSIDIAQYNDAVSSSFFVKAFSYSTVIGIFFIGFFSFNAFAGQKKRGFLASNITPLQRIQNTLFNIQQDVKDIKKGINDIKKGIGKIGNLGGVIANPQKEQDYYHNARVYMMRSDRAKARKAYEKYITFNRRYVDPHLSYQDLLKNAEGISATRRIYRELKAKYPKNPAVSFAHAKLLEDKQRIAAFKQIVQTYPNFVPVYLALSKEFSHQQLGSQTNAERAKEMKYLKMFKEKGGLKDISRFYLAQEESKSRVKAASTMLKMYENNPFFKAMAKNPVKVQASEYSKGDFQVTFIILGGAKEIFYKLPHMSDFKSTGKMSVKNPVTGQNMPNYNIKTTKLQVGDNLVQVKYKDMKDQMNGPFEVNAKIEAMEDTRAKHFIQYQWSLPLMKRLRVGRAGRRLQMMPMFVASGKQYFKTIRYSFNRPSLNRTLIKDGKGKSMISLRKRSGRVTLYLKGEMPSGWTTGLLKYTFNARVRGWKNISPAE